MGHIIPRTPERNAERDAIILDAAMGLSRSGRYDRVTRSQLADATGMSPATISNFGQREKLSETNGRVGDAMGRLRDAVMREAIERGWIDIVAQGLADGNPIATGAPEAIKQMAANTLVGR